jgi:hypothetical protein
LRRTVKTFGQIPIGWWDLNYYVPFIYFFLVSSVTRDMIRSVIVCTRSNFKTFYLIAVLHILSSLSFIVVASMG